MIRSCLILTMLLAAWGPRKCIAADTAEKPAALVGLSGDQGDGTYINPIIPGDFSDVDAIRVGNDFYAISSTMQFSPGMVILRSKDLVNWRIAGHAVSDVTQIGPEMNWDRMGRYGRGVWAGAIRFHAGKFWVYFGTPDEGLFMTSAADVGVLGHRSSRCWRHADGMTAAHFGMTMARNTWSRATSPMRTRFTCSDSRTTEHRLIRISTR